MQITAQVLLLLLPSVPLHRDLMEVHPISLLATCPAALQHPSRTKAGSPAQSPVAEPWRCSRLAPLTTPPSHGALPPQLRTKRVARAGGEGRGRSGATPPHGFAAWQELPLLKGCPPDLIK